MDNVVCLMDINEPRHIDNLSSEEDILYLQDIFLQPGFHHICVPTVEAGRSIIYSLTQALDYYHSLACFTCTNNPPLECSILGIYDILVQQGFISDVGIEHFFLEYFDADFLWIEITDKLAAIPESSDCIRIIRELEFANHMPVITVTYDLK